ncbi:MAG: Circadian input kinase A [uncultured Propionibacteriaceae bacterium]|uniref:histidine kinase n=1 Tax=uncultured Propionibacteriaceae bacterium TaxID=257457 RepID=A0A6J4P401_9ACTN|nr:MAG: Circadian input kinase A [uncultured Propionibacteriaceae bacterium]
MLCLAATAAVAVFVLLLASELPKQHRVLISDVGLLGGGMTLALSCGHRFLSLSGRRRRAWGFIALAGMVAAVGNLWVFAMHLTDKSVAAIDLANYGFFAALLLAMAGLVSFPSSPRRSTEVVRMSLDGVVIGGSTLVMLGLSLFPGLLAPGNLGVGSQLLPLVQAVFDVVLATLAGLLLLRVSRDDRPALALVSACFTLYALSDIAFAAMKAENPTFGFGTPIDAGWFAGYALGALAARHRAASVADHADLPDEGSPVFGTIVMFGVFSAAVLLWLFRAEGNFSAPITVVWLLVLLAVATRQVVLIKDNERLRHGLELRVSERTVDLQRLTRRSELLLSSVADGIYGVDRDGLITFINPVAAQMLGYRPEQLISKDPHAVFHAGQRNGSPYPPDSCYIAEAIREGRVSNAEEDTYIRADGSEIPVEVAASPLTREHAVEGAVVVFRDITQRREVDRMKNEFVSIVSHELRTPLTSIRGSLGLLSGGALGQLPPEATRLVKIAYDSSQRLTKLINDILDIERIQSGGLPLDITEHAARELVGAAVTQVQVLAREAGVTVVTDSVGGWVNADGDRAVQTLINLLGNAIKFSTVGSHVIVSAKPADAFVEFTVTDHGRGIPADKLEDVFNRFEQIDSSDAREKGGTGLGLAISRDLVEGLGGKIWAEQNPGVGTTFRFILPRAVKPEQRVARLDAPLVLVCDGVDGGTEALLHTLGHQGYRAISVRIPCEALDLVAAEHPAAIVMDLAVLSTAGAVVGAITQWSELHGIPVVVISAQSRNGKPQLSFEPAAWLVRPVADEQLTSTVVAAIAASCVEPHVDRQHPVGVTKPDHTVVLER